jgi:hypothetical protein
MPINTTLQLNDIQFLNRVLLDMRADLNFCYANTTESLVQHRVHPTLQRFAAKMQVLQAYIDALSEPAPRNDDQ